MTDTRLLMTPREAAEALAVSERTLRSLTKNGQVPHIKVGRLTRYPVDDLRQWIGSEIDGKNARPRPGV